jgi:zinc transport system substrate-binding protein
MARSIGVQLGHERQAGAFADRLLTLDGELRRGLRSCDRRDIVTSHAAFGYLARRYGL